MPREMVYGERAATEPPDPDNPASLEPISLEEYERNQPIAEVRWGRWPDSHVQVVTRLKGYEVCLNDKPSYAYGMYVDLDRDGINRFIKSLRRARDGAFKKDE